MQRDYSASEPELMDLPDQDETVLRRDLENIARLNQTFGAKRAVEKIFNQMTEGLERLVMIDLACGYGDHGRNLIRLGQERRRDVTVIAVDFQFQTLRLAREATLAGQKMFFVQADARQLPFRPQATDLALCSLALHHFAERDAFTVLREMRRVARRGAACLDLVRSRFAAFCIWLLTTFIMRDPMTRHDARLSIRRAFSHEEMHALAREAEWPGLKQSKFFWFQQAVLARITA